MQEAHDAACLCCIVCFFKVLKRRIVFTHSADDCLHFQGQQMLLQGMVNAWEVSCGTLDQYGMQYTRTFANLCNMGVSTAQLQQAACANKPVLLLNP